MDRALVIDTSVLIDYRRDVGAAVVLLDTLLAKNVACVHPVVKAEMVQGVRTQSHLLDTLAFLGAFRAVKVKSADHDMCLRLMTELRLSHGAEWPDCLIAATCLRLNLPIVTMNDKDFRPIRGLQVVRPY